ncbi:restriction endonuclease subunit S [Lactococcus lactis]|nr:restriction endonuclease subunit S [Lactococcus lactis]
MAKIDDSVKKKVPELRFPGFTDDWEERKLSDISNVTKLAGFEFTKYVRYQESGKIIALRGLNVKNGKLVLDEVKYIDDSDFSKLNRSKLYKNDILLTYVGTVGELAIVPENDKYYLAPNVARIRLQDHVNSIFVCQMMNDSNFYNRIISPLIATSSQPALSMENVRKFQLLMPDYQEQEKIGSFFKQLDDTIALHQRKLDLLKEQKKGYLQKMFPKNGAKVPELRFAGFADDWEERKLGDITKISTGKLDANAMVENGKYDFYTSGIKKYRIDVAAFEGPSITIAGNGATVGYMHLADNKFNAYQRTYVLQEFLVDRSFIFSEIGNKLPKKIKQEARTGNIPYIVMDMLTELKLSIPQNNSEQQKIGSFFKQLDDTIALHQRKLDLLKEQKKGFLQKMFV